MQTTWLPTSVRDEVEHLCRDFIWGSRSSHRKCHIVSWDTICKLKEGGGLGFRHLWVLNQCFIMKLDWQLIDNPNKLWVCVLSAKYGVVSLLFPL